MPRLSLPSKRRLQLRSSVAGDDDGITSNGPESAYRKAQSSGVEQAVFVQQTKNRHPDGSQLAGEVSNRGLNADVAANYRVPQS